MPYGNLNVDTVTTSTTGGVLGAGNASIMKNRLINGDMRIDQRNAGASVTGNDNTYGVDRFKVQVSQSSKFTMQQNAGSVTPPVGFVNYLGITSSSAYSVGSTDYFFLQQRIEGYNIADLNWGSANAKTVTLSFQVRSSLTGTFGGVLQNDNQDRTYPFSYTISSANTWTSISVTIAGDTSGTWLTTNGMGIKVTWGLGVGSTYSGTAGSWAGANYFSSTGATSVVGTNGATFYITGVQLEVGSSATGFEYVNYQTSLANCQRYYEQYSSQIGNAYISIKSTSYYGYITWQVPKRAAPTIGGYTSFNFIGSAGDINTVTSAVFDNQNLVNTRFYATSVGPFTPQSAYVYVNGTLSISAEL